MTTKQVYDAIMRHEPEWIRAFNELVTLCEEATPDQRMIVSDSTPGIDANHVMIMYCSER